jgi:two-component system, NarL family, nitrate/nitrite response regulator NarL
MKCSDPTLIMIVSDHAMLRQGLVFALKPYGDLEIVATACNSQESALLYPAAQPQVVLVDGLMLDRDGIHTIRLLRHLNKQLTILVFTYFNDDPGLATEALLAGADHCISKQTSVEQLIALIRTP